MNKSDFTPEELALAKEAFNNKPLMQVLSKVLTPMPELWLKAMDMVNTSNEQVGETVKAMTFFDGTLKSRMQQLATLAAMDDSKKEDHEDSDVAPE